MTRHLKPRRIGSFLLAMAMIISLAAFIEPPARAAGYTGNPVLDAAIDAKIGAAGMANPSTVYMIDLSGDPNVYGDVDVDTLIAPTASGGGGFTNLLILNVSQTNVTSIIYTGSGVNVMAADTFASGDRWFVVNSPTAVQYRESDVDFPVSNLLDRVTIHATDPVTSTGTDIPIPAGMLLNGDITLTPGPGAYTNISPTGAIAQNLMVQNAAGIHTVALDFPVAYSDLAVAGTYFRMTLPNIAHPTNSVNLSIAKSGYFLNPATGATVYDGGSMFFTLTKVGADGLAAPVGAVTDYDIVLYVNAIHNLLSDAVVSSDGMSMRITVTAADILLGGPGSTSATLQIYDAGSAHVPNVLPPPINQPPTPATAPGFLVQANLTKQSNPVVSNLRFVEYNPGANSGAGYMGTPFGANNSGGQININGGTSISSVTSSNLSSFTTTTMYLLEGDTGIAPTVHWEYLPARYLSQVSAASWFPADLAGDIVAVPNPNPSPAPGFENILALVVTSKTNTAATYTSSGAGTEPILVSVDNGVAGGGVTTDAYMDVRVFVSTALGTVIYQIPDIYSGYTAQDIENAIANSDPYIKLVAQFETNSVSGAWENVTPAGINGAEVVEDSTIYLVAAAYFQSGGQAFIIPDTMINGWYDTNLNMSNMFNSTPPPKTIGTTSMEAMLPSAGTVNFDANTVVLEVSTDAWEQTVNPETSGMLIFAPNGIPNNVDIPISKVPKAIIAYIIAPPSYATAPGNNIFDELQDEIAAVLALPAGTYVPGTYRLYDLNVEGEDTIAIGGANNYEIWTVYSNFQVSNTYTANVSGGVTMTSAVSPVPVSAQDGASNSLFDAVATSSGGTADALAGSTVDMTYTAGSVSSATVTLTLTNSEINGLYLVFEDYFGNLYSSAAALYNNFSDIDDLGQLAANFQIPEGTDANVYAVFAFDNAGFYTGVTNWRDYVANPATVSFSGGGITSGNVADNTPAIIPPAQGYRSLTGVTASLNNAVVAATSLTSVTIGSTTFTVSGTVSLSHDVDVIPPLITGVVANDTPTSYPGANVPNGVTVSDFVVGDSWDTDPDVRLTGTVANTSLTGLTPVTGYTGDVELVPSIAAAVDFLADFELGFKTPQTFTIKYEYTYEINGVSDTVTLKDITAPANDYVVTINVGYPTIDGIYLVASNPSSGTLTWWGNGGFIPSPPGSDNEYTLPYTSMSTVRLYPVIMSSLINLDPGYSGTPPAAISAADVDGSNFSYIKAADFTVGAPWSLLLGNSSDYIGAAQVDAAGYIYYNVQFAGPVDLANYLSFQFNAAGLTFLAATPYTGAASGAATLEMHHMPDRDSAYIVDITATDIFAPSPSNYYVGNTAEFIINYSLSTSTNPLAPGSFDVPTTYFDIPGTLSVMPNSTTNADPHNASANNALRVEELSVPASGSYTFTSAGSNLLFVPTMVGTYSFKLYTINNAGLRAPNFAPQYTELTFYVIPSVGTAQTVYWAQPQALVIPTGVTGTIEEAGGPGLLDAAALSAGILKMSSNTDGTTTVNIKDAGGTVIVTIPVTTVAATATTVALNIVTGNGAGGVPPLPLAMTNGETRALYWDVTYTPTTGAPYTVPEQISTFTALAVSNGASLGLTGSQLTATAGTVSTIVIYQAAHAATGTTENFFATISPTAPPTPNSYTVRDSANAPVGATLTLTVGESRTLNVWNNTSGAAVTGISQIDSGNPAAVLASGFGSGANFTLSGLTAGTSVVTVYPADAGGGSVSITVTVVPATPTGISISSQPASQTVTEPNTATFNVTASTTAGTLTYQWQVSTDGGLTWANVTGGTGANTASYTTGATSNATDNGNQYRCVLNSTSTGVPTVYSNAATLTVNPIVSPITITTQPANASVIQPVTATFSISASTTAGTLTYQWEVNTGSGWTTIAGATGSSYTTPATTTAMSGNQYRCVLTDTASNTLTSNAATLTVTTGGPGGGGGPTTYNITVNAGAGGSASANVNTASAGATVTVTVTPDSDHAIDSVTAKTDAGAAVTLTLGSDGKYTFTMPAADVTVTVTFKTDYPSQIFDDVAQDAWYREYVDYVVKNGIMQGTGATTFEPNINLTRAMMVQILYNIEGQPAPAGGADYDDVPADAWFADAIAWGTENGVVEGYGDGNFGPGNNVLREQMAAIFYRYANYKGYDTSAYDDLAAFADAGDVSEFAVPAMHWAVGAGLINGRDATHIVPKGTASRSEVAAIVTRFCRLYNIF